MTIDDVSESGNTIPCVGAVVRDEKARILLVRRGRAPGEGLWSIPGGRVEAGESDAEAVIREVKEETGLVVDVGRFAGRVTRDGPGGVVFDIADYECRAVGGVLAAGDDAADVRWVAPEELRTLPTSEGLVEALTEWGFLR